MRHGLEGECMWLDRDSIGSVGKSNMYHAMGRRSMMQSMGKRSEERKIFRVESQYIIPNKDLVILKEKTKGKKKREGEGRKG